MKKTLIIAFIIIFILSLLFLARISKHNINGLTIIYGVLKLELSKNDLVHIKGNLYIGYLNNYYDVLDELDPTFRDWINERASGAMDVYSAVLRFDDQEYTYIAYQSLRKYCILEFDSKPPI